MTPITEESLYMWGYTQGEKLEGKFLLSLFTEITSSFYSLYSFLYFLISLQWPSITFKNNSFFWLIYHRIQSFKLYNSTDIQF